MLVDFVVELGDIEETDETTIDEFVDFAGDDEVFVDIKWETVVGWIDSVVIGLSSSVFNVGVTRVVLVEYLSNLVVWKNK